MFNDEYGDQASKGEDRAGPVILAVLVVVVAWVSWYRHHDLLSRDALSVWMAAEAWAVGAFDQIYAPVREVFLMRPPESWFEARWAVEDFGTVFPYLYPPIWAALLAPLTHEWTFEDFASFLAFFNPLVLGCSIALAARMCVPAETRPAFAVVGMAFMALSAIGIVALEQNQPQIIVAALTVLAIFLSFIGQGLPAGAVLALAASLKLSPALFVIVFIARGDTRALGGFLLIGAALGTASIVMTGWPLHAHMLEMLGSISRSVLNTYFTFSVDPVLAERFFFSELRIVPANPLDPQDGGWSVMPKPTWWRIMNAALLIGALALVFRAARRFDDVLVWPFAITILSLVSPLSWGYHYLAALVFVPALLWRLPRGVGALAVFAVFVPLSVAVYRLVIAADVVSTFMATVGTLTLMGFAALLYWAMALRAKA